MTAGAPEPPSDENPWSRAIDQTRDVSRWLGGALATIATAIFGAGPLIEQFDGDLSGTQWRLVALGLALGLGGLFLAVGVLARVQTPSIATVQDAPASLIDRLPALCGFPDHPTLESFLADRAATQIVVDRDLGAVRTAGRAVRRAEQDLDRAVRAQGSSTADISAARRVLDGARAAEAGAVASWESSTRDLGRLIEAEVLMLDVARMSLVRRSFMTALPVVMVAAGVSVIGGVVYLSALGGDGDGDGVAGVAGAAIEPQLVELVPFGPTDLLDALGLPDECRTALLTGGDGLNEPYEVTVAGLVDPDCPNDLRFTATAEHLALEIATPKPVTIVNETPEPETDWTWVWVVGLGALLVGGLLGVSLGSEYVSGRGARGASRRAGRAAPADE